MIIKIIIHDYNLSFSHPQIRIMVRRPEVKGVTETIRGCRTPRLVQLIMVIVIIGMILIIILTSLHHDNHHHWRHLIITRAIIHAGFTVAITVAVTSTNAFTFVRNVINVWMIIKVMKMSHSENHVKNTERDENNQDLTITLLLLLPLPIQRFPILVRLVSPLHLLHLRALVLKPDLVKLY